MSERLCQFFIRGRCLRDVCEFLHPADLPPATSKDPEDPPEVVAIPEEQEISKKVSGFESDEDVRPESDDESIASGFTEKPMAAKTEAEQKDEEDVPAEGEKDDSIVEISSTIKNPTPPVPKEDWNFVAAAAAAVTDVAKTSTPLLPRRAAKTAQSQAASSIKEAEVTGGFGESRPKSIRRDSKGFELLEDYFSDSETDKSTDKTLPVEKDSEEIIDPELKTNVEDNPNTVDKNSEKEELTPVVAETNSDIVEVDQKNGDQVEEAQTGSGKSAVAELTRDWEDEEGTQADGGETIESIESFMQGNSANETTSEAQDVQQEETSNKPVETFVSVPEKSVYDLDPDELDNQTASKTNYKGEAKAGLQPKKQNLIKKEGVTKIGNNVYYYTGKGENEEGVSDGEGEDEDDENEDWDETELYDNVPSTEGNADGEEKNTSSRRIGRNYATGRRKHSTSYVYGARSSAKKTRRCGECEGCNREECGLCPTCLDKPKFGGSGLKKQACVHRLCIWKNPSGKKTLGVKTESTPYQSRAKEAAMGTSVNSSPALGTRTTRRSIAVIASASKETPQPTPIVSPSTPTQTPRRGRPPGSGAKRKLGPEPEKKPAFKKQKAESNGTTEESGEGSEENGQPSEDASQDIRSVPFLNDGEDNREVLINCFAPYDEHKWTNIGKKKEGVDPQAVQYARALRPPYHLLSFLRIHGNSSKGSSSTNRNTMVFIVLQGQITVELHRTKLVAKAGDSFYIPPRNFYNLINDTSEVAELTLMQFQYDGPLTSLPAGSQSGVLRPADD